jgi:hypothetical protein
VRGDDILISKNKIYANGGCPDDLLASHDFYCADSAEELAYGIYVEEESYGVSIGDTEGGNEIHYNRDGAIAIPGNLSSDIMMTENTTSQNYGLGLGIDLGMDDRTINDRLDEDAGVNDLLNYIDYFQTFQLPPTDPDEDRYWGWGVGSYGDRVEVYRAPSEDWDRGMYHAGGDKYLGKAFFNWLGFEINSDEYDFGTYYTLTFVTIGEGGKTSEFSYAVPVGEDFDFDGVINRFEAGDGSSESEGSYADNPDTDADGLADVVEDKNHNGVWDSDLGETSTFIADSDEDGVSDFYEVRGDNLYDVGYDTDPLGTDSDGDGLQDGAEDTNGNGILEVYLNETDPMSQDTDQDGFDDHNDNCPSIYNPTQNSGYCKD